MCQDRQLAAVGGPHCPRQACAGPAAAGRRAAQPPLLQALAAESHLYTSQQSSARDQHTRPACRRIKAAGELTRFSLDSTGFFP